VNPPSTNLGNPADAQLPGLLARCALGDRLAFRRLYDATAARLLGVIAQLVGRGALAEDILQDVYVRIWKSAGQYRADAGTPMAWMAAAARYRAIDHLRARAARPEIAVGDLPARPGHGEDDDGDDLTRRQPDPDPGPDAGTDARASASAVQDCLDTLLAPQRQSIKLAFYQGLSHGEIADHLGAPLGTVKGWVRRGLIALRACLEHCSWAGAGE
jgi:RNA polymerase sigma-70 factor (ECF subfamily)